MSDGRSNDPRTVSVRRVRDSMYHAVHEAFISGLAVVIPLVITVVVFLFIFNGIYRYVSLLSNLVVSLPVVSLVPVVLNVSPETIVEAAIPIVVFGAVLCVGFLVNRSQYGERAVEYFDYVMSQIPGVGAIYQSFRRMSDAMFDSDAENFREVMLVEFPHEDAYTLGFVTTETPEPLCAAAGHERMLTLFLPLAPNPVMGGHLAHVPEDRVYDVEMSVEEGLQAIVTSGVAMTDESRDGLSREELASLTDDSIAGGGGAGAADDGAGATDDGAGGADGSGDPSRADGDPADAAASVADRYDERVDPAHAETPAELARRERDADDRAETEVRPERAAARPADEGGE